MTTWQKNLPINGRYSANEARFVLGMSIGELIWCMNPDEYSDKHHNLINIDYADLEITLGNSENVFISSASNKNCSVAIKEAVDTICENIDSYVRFLALVITTGDFLMSSFNSFDLLKERDVIQGLTIDENADESYVILVCAETEAENRRKKKKVWRHRE